MRMNLLKFATCFAIGAAVLVACEQTEMEPVFPDEIITDADVNTTSEVIEFTANLDWELSLPMETISFFWLEDEEGNNLDIAKDFLGSLYLNGEIIKKDEKKAFELFSNSNELMSKFKVGFCYFNGYGVKKDEKKGFEIYQNVLKEYEEQINKGILDKNDKNFIDLKIRIANCYYGALYLECNE